ncbi:hypothetical protein QA802_28405 [Streptomyces sp. B21-105]|uniref:hypothetical protein n=1 Tax=Streptomyces sp. B21-105 TaxID=3039417 RepID=UPI002FF3E151
MCIGLPGAAAVLAAAVAGALLTSSAEAAEAAETPPTPKITVPSAKELQKRSTSHSRATTSRDRRSRSR